MASVCFHNDGGNAELKVEENKEYSIALEGNPTTGYSWYMTNVDTVKNSNSVEMLNLDELNGSDDYVSNAKEPGLCGASGVFYFKFKVKSVASDLPKLVFEYKRPWEKKPSSNRAEVTLKV